MLKKLLPIVIVLSCASTAVAEDKEYEWFKLYGSRDLLRPSPTITEYGVTVSNDDGCGRARASHTRAVRDGQHIQAHGQSSGLRVCEKYAARYMQEVRDRQEKGLPWFAPRKQ